MNKAKYCVGCGELLQSEDKTKGGFVLNADSKFCKSCFQNKNYGIVNEENQVFLNIDKTLNEIKSNKQGVILIIDILNPYETLIKGMNNYIKKDNLILIVNKRDVFPKAVSDEKIRKWISNITKNIGFSFDKMFIVSSTKQKNIDTFFSYLEKQWNKEYAVIGYSNVGKSSFLNSLFASKGKKIENLISNSLSTTKNKINLSLKDIKLVDYPGFFLSGSYQNIVNSSELKKINPQREIKVKNYQLMGEQIINVENYAFFATKDSKEYISYQFLFSNNLNLTRHKFNDKMIADNYKKAEITNLNTYIKYDLIISGLGIITFKKQPEVLILFLPENVKYNLLESLFN